jgi:Flp pilus assembly protein TadG
MLFFGCFLNLSGHGSFMAPERMVGSIQPRYLRRRGNIVVLSAFLLVVMVALVAFAVDVGLMSMTRTEMQRATDSAALAGAGELINGTPPAYAEAVSYLTKNQVGTKTLAASDAKIDFGRWDTVNRTFTITNDRPNAIRVNASTTMSTMFGKVLGGQDFVPKAESIAIYQPREISLVLDYSGSMCFDSQLRSIHKLGRSAVETNMAQIWNELGKPKFGKLNWAPVKYGTPATSNSSVKSYFGLTSVPYPCPGGSWDEFIDYVQTDSNVDSAGYNCSYGMLTMLDYVLAKRCSYADTPVLWAVSEQPVTAVKDAVDVFLDYLTVHSTDDRVAFTLYTAADSTAILEQPLTKTFDLVSTKVRQRQAGHYVGGTNISAGMTKGRLELQNNSRVGAFRMMVLMTDGVVNMPTGNTNQDKQLVRDEAQLCAAAKIPIVTISVGAGADTALMQEVADITNGAAFVIPGGQTVAQIKAQLEDVFAQVAANRPLKLVK